MEPIGILWSALAGVNEVNLPLHFTRSLDATASARRRPVTRRAAMFTGVSAFQMNLVNILAPSSAPPSSSAIRTSGSPSARAASADPYALDRMDFEWEDRFRDLGLTMSRATTAAPVQGHVPVRPDRTKLIDDMGWRRSCGRRTTRTDGVARVVEVHREQFGHLPPTWFARSRARMREFYGLIR